MRTIDSLIHCDWIAPIVPRQQILEQHAIAIHNGRIIDILPQKVSQQSYAAMHNFNLKNHIVMPGLINAHNHAAMTLFRGIADDMALMTWLNNHIWPSESRWVNEAFVEQGTRLALAEMLRSGTTCFNDMYFFPEVSAKVIHQVGMRACLGLLMLDFPTPWGSGPEEYLRKMVTVHDEIKRYPLVSTCLAPHAPYTVSDSPLERVRTIAEELDVPIQMHVHETKQEVEDSLGQYGQRPLERLDHLGLLSPRLQAVHMAWLDNEDLKRVAHNGVSVVHCPESNMKLGSGICPIAKLLDQDTNVAIGTDGAASNNDLDMFGEMQSAALLAKVATLDAAVMSAEQTLYCATMGGAKAMAMENECGSIEIGKQADIIAINMDSFNVMPRYNCFSHLVYSLNSRQVDHVWVKGKHLLSDGKLTTIDESALKAETLQWQEKIQSATPSE